jgi:hypothetical protein
MPLGCDLAKGITVASVSWKKRGKRYLVYWRADDGSQGGETVDTQEQARLTAATMLLDLTRGTWAARQRAKLTLAYWDVEWWRVWSAAPDRSPTTLAATERRRRLHVLPQLGRRPLEAITPRVLRQWQDQLAGRVGYETAMACRSIVFRVLKFAEDEGAIPANPMVPAPDPPVDPDEIFGDGQRRAYTPEEAGQLLAYFPRFGGITSSRFWERACASGSSPASTSAASLTATPSRSCRWSTRATRPAGSAVASSLARRAAQACGRFRPPGGRGDPPAAPAWLRPRHAGVHRAGWRQRR